MTGFISQSQGSTSTDGVIGHISSVCESLGNSEALLRDSAVLIWAPYSAVDTVKVC